MPPYAHPLVSGPRPFQTIDKKKVNNVFFFPVMTYMRFVEDYSEPQPSVFYQTPQNEHIYQQKNKHLREVYGFNDSFSGPDTGGGERAPPPALPPKQRQLVRTNTIYRERAPRQRPHPVLHSGSALDVRGLRHRVSVTAQRVRWVGRMAAL